MTDAAFRTPHGTLANALRQLRLQKNLTQCQLAKRIDRTQSAIASYESGRIAPSMKTAQLLAIELSVPYEFLLGHRRSLFNRETAFRPPLKPITMRTRKGRPQRPVEPKPPEPLSVSDSSLTSSTSG